MIRAFGEHQIDPKRRECVICGSTYDDILEGRGRRHIPDYGPEQYQRLDEFNHEVQKLQRAIGQTILKFQKYKALHPVWIGAGEWDLGWDRNELWVKSNAGTVSRITDISDSDLVKLCAAPNLFEALDEKIRNSVALDIKRAKEAFTNLYNFLEKSDVR